MSVRRHLEFFAALKGLPRKEISSIARAVATAVGLGTEDVYRRNAGLLSGGMRRRLSIGMSLIGAPRVLILDEPTTGYVENAIPRKRVFQQEPHSFNQIIIVRLDPSTKSSIWSLIKALSADDRSIIISTHMMMEAETLCDRIAILADGKLAMVGEQHYLKEKFGNGYLLQLNLVHNSPDQTEQALTFVQTRLHPDARLSSRQVKTLHFHLPQSINLKAVFKALQCERSSTQGCINQFGLMQATLEEVFIAFGDGRRTQIHHSS